MGRKATTNPLGDVPKMESRLCAFCDGKEVAQVGVTEHAIPMGENCFGKAIDKGVVWDYNTTLTQIKSLIRQRTRG
jgi:hypothetical protein